MSSLAVRHDGVHAFSDRTPLPETTEKLVMSPEDKSRNIARMAVENFTLGAGRTAFINQAIEANFDLREQILADLAVKEAEEKIQVGVRATVSKFVA